MTEPCVTPHEVVSRAPEDVATKRTRAENGRSSSSAFGWRWRWMVGRETPSSAAIWATAWARRPSGPG